MKIWVNAVNANASVDNIELGTLVVTYVYANLLQGVARALLACQPQPPLLFVSNMQYAPVA